MKILFLTSSPGYGHTRAAQAIAAQLRQRNPDSEIHYLDVTHLLNEQVSSAVQDSYLRMTVEQPELYQKLYNMDRELYRQLAGRIPADQALVNFLNEQQQRWYPLDSSYTLLPSHYNNLDSALLNTFINGICNRTKVPAGRLLLKGLLGLIYSILATRLKNYVNHCAPDLLIATQMYPNALLARAIKKGVVTQPIIGVITDYGVHGVWVRDTTDLYCVSHQAAADRLRQLGVVQSRIQVSGIPLMPEFENPPTQLQARISLGLDERPTVLVTGGQCGIGTLDVLKQLLQQRDHTYRILLTASQNSASSAELELLAREYPERLRLFAWGDSMASLFSAADVVIGKPGGLTVSEALACGRPFFATCCLGGQEAHNLEFLTSQGAGRYVALTQLADALHELFADPASLIAMKQRAEQSGRRYASRAIVNRIEAVVRAKKYLQYQSEVSSL